MVLVLSSGVFEYNSKAVFLVPYGDFKQEAAAQLQLLSMQRWSVQVMVLVRA